MGRGMTGFGSSDPVAAATQAIRDYCGWHVAPVEEETITLDGTGTDTLLLPSRLVVAVTSVKVRGEDLVESAYEWSAIGALRRLGGCWPDAYRSVEITLEHGFTDMSVLADVVDSIAARVRMDPTGAVSSQRAGTQHVGFFKGHTGGGLLESERNRLAPYRLNWGP